MHRRRATSLPPAEVPVRRPVRNRRRRDPLRAGAHAPEAKTGLLEGTKVVPRKGARRAEARVGGPGARAGRRASQWWAGDVDRDDERDVHRRLSSFPEPYRARCPGMARPNSKRLTAELATSPVRRRRGAERIRGELLKLGMKVAKRGTPCREHGAPPAADRGGEDGEEAEARARRAGAPGSARPLCTPL
jgi:hypothetical protein